MVLTNKEMKQIQASVIFLFLAGLTTADYGWRPGMQYNYNIRGRTVTGLNDVANQFTGVLMRGKLNIQAKSDSTLSLQVKGAEYAEVHANLSSGWDTDIPEESLHYMKLPFHDQPFELYLEDGIIKEMIVDNNVPTWEVNMLKSIVSLLQVDTQAKNIKDSRFNLVPRSEMGTGAYKIMEDSIHGIYETIYDVSLLPEILLQSKPQLLPLPNLKGNGKVFQIFKNRNFLKSNQHVVYHYGINGQTHWKPGSNHMGNFLTRTSVSQIIISGDLKHYTIQSSVTSEKNIIAPHLYNHQKGMVGARMNLTIESVNSIKKPFSVVSNPQPIRNLVYEYNPIGDEKDSSGRIVNIKDNLKTLSEPSNHDSSSLTSSESGSVNIHESFHLPNFELSKAPLTTFIPFYISEENENLYELNSTVNLIRLAKEISEGILNPNTITGEHILSKFSSFVRVLRTMSAHQLKEVSDNLYYPYLKAMKTNNQHNAISYQSWITFRDAVGQAGTGPALMTIRDWIVSKKVEGEESSCLVSALSNAAKLPTIEYLNYFFEMLNDDAVKDHISLKMNAVLSFTDLVRKALVDRHFAHNYYSFHFYGPLTDINDRTLTEKYIPYFQKQLQTAAKENDSINIQLYIRALNNIAHPLILSVFEPYLEGKISISKFQRLTIIASMDKILKLYSHLARTVLFRIYQNLADRPEIRVAAVMQLMKTNPPVQMLQRMAEATNYEPIKQVNAAVKSAIVSIANQEENVYNKEMVKKARAAVNMLTPENYGVQYSRNFINSYIVKEQNLAYKLHWAHIQKPDSLFPSSLFYSLKHSMGGYKSKINEVQFMTSSMKKLFRQLYGVFFSHSNKPIKDNRKNHSNSKLSLAHIHSSLNFEETPEEPLEGNILATLLGGKRYFAFDNSSIHKIPSLLSGVATNLFNNKHFNYTKFYNQYSLEISFPTSMGLPFNYALETPTLLNMGAQMSGTMHPVNGFKISKKVANADTLKIAGNYHFLYSSHKEGKMGFIMPHNGKMYFAGLEKNVHVQVPIKMQVDLNLKDSEVGLVFEPLDKSKEQKLFEYSTTAFTTIQEYSSNPLATSKNTIFVHNFPMQTMEKNIGKEKIGFSFNFKTETDRRNMDTSYMYEKLKSHDFISLVSYIDMLDEINNQNYTLTYKPEESWSNSLKLSLAYKLLQTNTRSDGKDSIFDSTNNEPYKRNLLKNITLGIEDAETHVFKLNMISEGRYKTEYGLDLIYADSFVSNVSRILAFISNHTSTPLEPKTYMTTVQLTTEIPYIPLEYYHSLLHATPSTKVMGRIDFGEQPPFQGHILLEGELKTSEERRNYLRKHPLGILCEKENVQGYILPPSCRNITRRMNYLDKYQLSIDYQNVPDEMKDLIFIVYKYINNLWYDHRTESVDSNKNEGNIKTNIKFGKSLLYSNISIYAPDFSVKFEDVPIHEWIRPLVVVHPKHNTIERLGHRLLMAQFSPVCTFDKDRITTFDNSTYHVNMGNETYILAQNIPRERIPDDEYFAIFAHKGSLNELELTILIGNNLLEMKPGTATVNVIYNEKQVVATNSITELKDDNGNVLFKLLAVSENAVKVTAQIHGFEVTYIGNHAQVKVSSGFRDELRGLCGHFDGEAHNDLANPQNCILNDKEQFIASYSIFDISSSRSVKNVMNQDITNLCYKQAYSFGNIVNENEIKQFYPSKKKSHYEEKLKTRFLKNMFGSSNAFIN